MNADFKCGFVAAGDNDGAKSTSSLLPLFCHDGCTKLAPLPHTCLHDEPFVAEQLLVTRPMGWQLANYANRGRACPFSVTPPESLARICLLSITVIRLFPRSGHLMFRSQLCRLFTSLLYISRILAATPANRWYCERGLCTIVDPIGIYEYFLNLI